MYNDFKKFNKNSMAVMTRDVLIWSLTRLLWEGARRASSETGPLKPVFILILIG
jgi:hypothetical protein